MISDSGGLNDFWEKTKTAEQVIELLIVLVVLNF